MRQQTLWIAALALFVWAERAEAQTLPESDAARVDVVGRVGLSLVGAEAGGHIGFRKKRIEWATLDVSALFPSEGGFIRLSSGVNAIVGTGYVGGGVGVSRFDFGQSFGLLRVGLYRNIKAVPLRFEARFEHHERESNGGDFLTVSVGLQIR